MSLPFDSVVLEAPDGVRTMSPKEFLALPLHVRIQHILGRQVQFFIEGTPVERSVALDALRTAAAA